MYYITFVIFAVMLFVLAILNALVDMGNFIIQKALNCLVGSNNTNY